MEEVCVGHCVKKKLCSNKGYTTKARKGEVWWRGMVHMESDLLFPA